MPKLPEPDPDSTPGDDLTLDDFEESNAPAAGSCPECRGPTVDGDCDDPACPNSPWYDEEDDSDDSDA